MSAQVTDDSTDQGRQRWEGRLADVAPGTVDGWAGYAVGVPWALAEAGLAVPGFDAAIDGLVPLGSGLSSSAALECAVAVALDDVAALGLGGSDAGRARLAQACVRAENDIAGAPTGGMDQAASLRSAGDRPCSSTAPTSRCGTCRSTWPRPASSCSSSTRGRTTR